MGRVLCLSDLHLGDGRSALDDPDSADLVARNLAGILGREPLDTLVLNGDIWEECVPAGLGEPREGIFNRRVLAASRTFFSLLFGKVRVENVVWVPGNHDLNLWEAYLAKHAMTSPRATGPAGVVVEHDFFTPLFGKGIFGTFRVAYPVYCPTTDFPVLVFTHGHLMDPLVRGLGSGAAYNFLSVLGCRRPRVPEQVSSVKALAEATDPFTLALWQRYSRRDYTYANHVMRRLEHPASCSYGTSDRGSFTCGEPGSPRDGLGPQVASFLDLVLTDPHLPTPVGSLRPDVPSVAFTRPSCLVYGHDHLATEQTIFSCGVPFQVRDSGGWTSEWDGHHPHTHALVWGGGTVIPESYFLRTRPTRSI